MHFFSFSYSVDIAKLAAFNLQTIIKKMQTILNTLLI